MSVSVRPFFRVNQKKNNNIYIKYTVVKSSIWYKNAVI